MPPVPGYRRRPRRAYPGRLPEPPLPRVRPAVRRPTEGGPDATRALVRRPLRERMSRRGIARAVGVSRSWLQAFVNGLYRDRTPFEPGPLYPA